MKISASITKANSCLNNKQKNSVERLPQCRRLDTSYSKSASFRNTEDLARAIAKSLVSCQQKQTSNRKQVNINMFKIWNSVNLSCRSFARWDGGSRGVIVVKTGFGERRGWRLPKCCVFVARMVDRRRGWGDGAAEGLWGCEGRREARRWLFHGEGGAAIWKVADRWYCGWVRRRGSSEGWWLWISGGLQWMRKWRRRTVVSFFFRFPFSFFSLFFSRKKVIIECVGESICFIFYYFFFSFFNMFFLPLEEERRY